VVSESVCSDLGTVINSQHQITNKIFGSNYAAFADDERRNQFGFRIHRDKDPLIAKLCRVVFPHSALLLKAECPQLIALDVIANQIAHSGIMQMRASLP